MPNYSIQKEVIYKYLDGRTDHPTADQVYTAVKKKVPTVSRGTVYRNLGAMVERGELAKVDVGDGAEHFDPNNEKPHGHFTCVKCGSVSDIPISNINRLAKLAMDEGAEVDKVDVIISGICKKCRKKIKVYNGN